MSIQAKSHCFNKELEEWIIIDNQLKDLHIKTTELREKKNILNSSLFEHIDRNQINPLIKTNTGQLKFVNTNVQSALTFKYLEKSLLEIIKNESQVKKIIDYIKDKREIKVVREIKRI